MWVRRCEILFIHSTCLCSLLSGFVYNIARTRTRKASQIKKILAEYIEWSGIYLVFDYIVRYGIEGTRTKHELWNEVVYTISFYGVSVLWFLSALTIGLAFVLFIGQKSEKFYLLCGRRLFHRSSLFKVGVAL